MKARRRPDQMPDKRRGSSSFLSVEEDMVIDSGWFATDYDYSGKAEAVFEDPRAEFYGPASVRPDENGQPIVEITVERSSPPAETDFELLEIKFGSRPVPGGGRCVSFGGGSQNRASVTVRSEGGVFHGEPDWCYSFAERTPGQPLILRIRPTKSEYTVAPSEREKFLVLPLWNFVSEFPAHSQILERHPLRLLERDSSSAQCIPFQLDGTLAFIQQLPAVEKSGPGMTLGSCKAQLTAVAVAPFSDSAMIDPWGWYLNVFLTLLDFATGTKVGTPWIELRDGGGKLVRRLHFAVGRPESLVDGYGAIRNALHWGNGEFLTDALSSAEAREPFFLIAVRHCFRAGLPGLSLDDQFAHLVRALECLCARYGCSKKDLTSKLDPKLKNSVGMVLKGAGTEIRKLAPTVADPDHRQVSRIAERAESAGQIDRSFGLAVESLAEHFQLLDSAVLGPYYSTYPGPEGRDWVKMLSYYRGEVFHEGFINLDGPRTPGEVFGFILHLHDLLVRILLKIIGYHGMYQPRLIRATAAETTDWFRPGIPVDGLLRVPTLGLRRPSAPASKYGFEEQENRKPA